MKKVSWQAFLKAYIELELIMLFFSFILGPSEDTSIPVLILVGLPITAIMLFTGWDEKLKKYFP
ncbi:hypothetical protein [Bacillus massiliglaciei]|uniref:hypothetical protein n=1 Tax=Bacillus massiliglaciei TaxID=1816693 RepID=UPI000DA5F0B1|nr:hypothetical protein [Bacillus massiliglaciei]